MARFESGWIKIHRKLVSSDIGRNGHCLAIATTLFAWANRYPTKIRWMGTVRELPKGSLVIGIRDLAAHLGFSKDTVHRHLRYLASRDTITLEPATEGTIVTILNYSDYQDSEEILRHEEGHERDTGETPAGREQGHEPTPIRELRIKDKDKNKEHPSGDQPEKPGQLDLVKISESPALKSEIGAAKVTAAEHSAKVREFIGAYVKAYQSRWPGQRPEDLNDGKTQGQIKAWIKEYPLERAKDLIQAYFQLETKWFGTKGYDFFTFRNNLNAIAQAFDSGVDPAGDQIDWSKVKLAP